MELARIRALVGPNSHVIGAVSGGVDSTVAAVLMTKAIGDRFHAVLVDNGVMRLNECAIVKKTLKDQLGINLTVSDAADEFLSKLKGVTDPEKKRKIIGNTFIHVFERESEIIEKKLEIKYGANTRKIEFLLQGTLYPDVIESISFKGPSATIKTHHVRFECALMPPHIPLNDIPLFFRTLEDFWTPCASNSLSPSASFSKMRSGSLVRSLVSTKTWSGDTLSLARESLSASSVRSPGLKSILSNRPISFLLKKLKRRGYIARFPKAGISSDFNLKNSNPT